jgi:hypothetical protein
VGYHDLDLGIPAISGKKKAWMGDQWWFEWDGEWSKKWGSSLQILYCAQKKEYHGSHYDCFNEWRRSIQQLVPWDYNGKWALWALLGGSPQNS